MRTSFRAIALAAVVGTAAFGVTSAAQAIAPAGAPSFTVAVAAPQTIVRGVPATVTVTITNLTETNRLAQASWVLLGPNMTAAFSAIRGHFTVSVPAYAAVDKAFTFTVPTKAKTGLYKLTVNVAGAAAPALTTITVS